MPRKSSKAANVNIKVSAPAKKSYPRKAYASGRGDYGLGSAALAIGKALAPGIKSLGAKGVAHLVDRIGSKLSGWVRGKGDYEISGNSLINPSQVTMHSEAMFKPMKHGVRIAHREYVGDVLSSTSAFSVTNYTVSPTDGTCFPWLAMIANNFEQYRVLGAIWEYVPQSGSVSTSQALGYVAFATEYDSNKPVFVNKAQMLNTEFANEAVPCKGLLHPLECDPAETSVPVLYTSPNGIPLASENKNFVNFCNTAIAVGGCPTSGQVLGALYLNYDIELLKPRPSVVVDQGAQLHWRLVAPAANQPWGALGTQVLLSTNISPQFKPEMVYFGNNTQMTIEGLPIGTILKFDYYDYGTAVAITAMSNTVSGAVGVNAFNNQTVNNVQTPAGLTSGIFTQSIVLQTTASKLVYDFGLTTGNIPFAGPSKGDLYISIINPPA